MFRLTKNPNHIFKDFLNCIAFNQAQQISEESLDPQPFIEKNLETDDFCKVLSTHCILKKNIKPIISILLLVTNANYTNIAVYQYIIKPISLKNQKNTYHQTPLYEVKKIWEIGRLFNPVQHITLYKTLYNSNSPRLLESESLEVFLTSISGRSIDFQNKDTRSLSKSAMIYDNKVELIPLPIPPSKEPTKSLSLITANRMQEIILNLEKPTTLNFDIKDNKLNFYTNSSSTKVSFDIEYIKKNPSTIYNELLYLSIDPYTILDSFNSIGVRFQHLSYSTAKTLAQSLSLTDLLHFKGLESHFDLVILELYKRKILY